MKRRISQIIIHCSASPNGQDLRADYIDAEHRKRGFKRDSQWMRAYNPHLKSIGYHRVIGVHGSVETGRHLEEIGAHVQGNNKDSVGVVLMGYDKFTQLQWDGLRNEIIKLSSEITGRTILSAANALLTLKEVGITVRGHRDYSPDLNGDGQITRSEWIKLCPNFEVGQYIKQGMTAIPSNLLKV